MSVQDNQVKRKRTEFRQEWLNTTVEFETIICDHDTGIHKLKKQTAKLSTIYDYSASANMIICKICCEVAPHSDFGKGKS